MKIAALKKLKKGEITLLQVLLLIRNAFYKKGEMFCSQTFCIPGQIVLCRKLILFSTNCLLIRAVSSVFCRKVAFTNI